MCLQYYAYAMVFFLTAPILYDVLGNELRAILLLQGFA